MTACHPIHWECHSLGSRDGVGRFDGGHITSDGGGLRLRDMDRRLEVLHRLAECCSDYRNPQRIEHSVRALVAQRV